MQLREERMRQLVNPKKPKIGFPTLIHIQKQLISSLHVKEFFSHLEENRE